MPSDKRRSGQALVMVTLALFAMLGLMGLLVDFGWAFFVEKMSQNAADAAALAAVQAGLQAAGTLGGAPAAPAGRWSARPRPSVAPRRRGIWPPAASMPGKTDSTGRSPTPR
jgi:hypothetical protein